MAPVQVDELVDHDIRKVVGREVAERGDGGAHLIEVRGARVAVREVGLEPRLFFRWHHAFEVLRHQLDRVAAHQGAAAPEQATGERGQQLHTALSIVRSVRYSPARCTELRL